MISVQSTSKEGRFGEDDVRLLNTIAANVGAAIQNARLFQESQRRAEEMATLAEYLLPLVQVGGAMMAQKGEDAAVEVQASDAAITALGGRVRQLVPVELRGLAETRYLVVVDKVASTPDKYPRRPGIPKKRPIRQSDGQTIE